MVEEVAVEAFADLQFALALPQDICGVRQFLAERGDLVGALRQGFERQSLGQAAGVFPDSLQPPDRAAGQQQVDEECAERPQNAAQDDRAEEAHAGPDRAR